MKKTLSKEVRAYQREEKRLRDTQKLFNKIFRKMTKLRESEAVKLYLSRRTRDRPKLRPDTLENH